MGSTCSKAAAAARVGSRAPARADAEAKRGLLAREQLLLRKVGRLHVRGENLGPPAAVVVPEKVPGPAGAIRGCVTSVNAKHGSAGLRAHSSAAASRRWLVMYSLRYVFSLVTRVSWE